MQYSITSLSPKVPFALISSSRALFLCLASPPLPPLRLSAPPCAHSPGLRLFATTKFASTTSTSSARSKRSTKTTTTIPQRNHHKRKPRTAITTTQDTTTAATSPFSAFYVHAKQQQQQQFAHKAGSDAKEQQQAPPPPPVVAPPGFWSNPSNHKLFLDWAGKQLGVTNLDDWYAIPKRHVERIGGRSLLQHYYNGSLQRALASVYPHFEWQPWRFLQACNGFWSEIDNQRKFMAWAANQLGVSENLDDWYQVTKENFDKIGGNRLLRQYNYSLQQALSALYPHHEWLPWRFSQAAKGFWHDLANHKKFLDWAGAKLGVVSLDDWYNITTESVENLGGGGLINRYYRGSLQQALSAVYPHHEWLPWRFQITGKGFWSELSNHKLFLEWAGKRLGVTELDDWYAIPSESVCELGGATLISNYYSSLQQALAAVYPQHEWLPWRWNQAGKGFWHEVDNHKKFLEWAGKQLGVTQLDDWYAIGREKVQALGGGGLLQQFYNGSLQQALAVVYPQHDWQPWRFDKTGTGFWSKQENQKLFLDWAGKQLGINSSNNLDGWYAITNDDIIKLGGSALLFHHNHSLPRVLSAVYPQHEWLPWRFLRTAKGVWDEVHNHKRFMDWAGKQLGVNELDDWYAITKEDLSKLGGDQLLRVHYDSSLHRALAAVYPEHEWQPWRFRSFDITNNKLGDDNDDVMKQLMEHLAAGLGIKQLDDWYRVGKRQIRDAGGPHAVQAIKQYGGLYAVLRRLYPQHAWAAERFEQLKGKKAAQRWLVVVLQKLFPTSEIIEEFTHPTLKFSRSRKNVTLDVYVPSLCLAFEYQGEQHYRDIRTFFDDVSARQEREFEKASLCRSGGITLVTVPYWWNRTIDDLAATIREVRPDLFVEPVQDSTNTNTTGEAYPNAAAMTSTVALRLQAAARGNPIPQRPPRPLRPQPSHGELSAD